MLWTFTIAIVIGMFHCLSLFYKFIFTLLWREFVVTKARMAWAVSAGVFHGNEVAGVFETLHMGMGSMGLKGTVISFKGLICLHF